MDTNQVRLKRKILGVLIRNARTQAGLELDEVATLLGISGETLDDYEYGQQEPSLPEMEAFARIFNVPIGYFWADDPFPQPDKTFMAQGVIAARRQEIGERLRQAREKAGQTSQDMASFLSCSTDRASGYETGKFDIPFSELQALSSYLNVSLSYFLDEKTKAVNGASPNTSSILASEAIAKLEEFDHLNDDIIDFLKDPANILYLKLAMRLQGLSADNLRSLAEGILDITY